MDKTQNDSVLSFNPTNEEGLNTVKYLYIANAVELYLKNSYCLHV